MWSHLLYSEGSGDLLSPQLHELLSESITKTEGIHSQQISSCLQHWGEEEEEEEVEEEKEEVKEEKEKGEEKEEEEEEERELLAVVQHHLECT